MPLQLRKGRQLGGGRGGIGWHRLGWGGLQERRRRTRWKKQLYTNDKRASLTASHWERALCGHWAASKHQSQPQCTKKLKQALSLTHTHMHASASLLPHAGEAATRHYVFLCLPEHANLAWWFLRASVVGQRTCGNNLVRTIPIWAVGVSPISLFIIRLSFYFPHRQNHSQ